MLESLATSSLIAWPLALTLATVVVSDRARTRRRRELANRAMHELRRPLQALTLAWPQPLRGERDHLGLALSALGELDRSINGSPRPSAPRAELIDAYTLAADAVRRWQRPAIQRGREIDLRWRANGSTLVCDRDALARALDNLIANALEHGAGPIRVDGSVREGRLRLSVADGGEDGSPLAIPSLRSRSVRRGHGLRIVAEIAADHGGRFAACAHGRGAQAVIEIPLATGARAAAG
jgi:signal transduction histidine kinase